MGNPSSCISQSWCWDMSSSWLADECALVVSLRTERNLSPMSSYKRTESTHGPITPHPNTLTQTPPGSGLDRISKTLMEAWQTFSPHGEISLWAFHHLTYLPKHRKVHNHNISHGNNQFKNRSGTYIMYKIAHACGLSTQYIRIFISSRMAWAM